MYHATRDVLKRLDHVQCKFLKDVGVDDVTALMEFNLAPLAVRRDIALLGVIHRTALGKGPPQFAEHFKRQGHGKHKFSMHDPRAVCKTSLTKRSALGLVAISNLLPADIISTKSVPKFQQGWQKLLKKAASEGHPKGAEIFSPRDALATHPLVSIS